MRTRHLIHATPRARPLARPLFVVGALATAGLGALVATPFIAPGTALVSNFVPVPGSPLFLAGLACLACAVTLLVLLVAKARWEGSAATSRRRVSAPVADRSDRRFVVVGLTAGVILAGGAAVSLLPGSGVTSADAVRPAHEKPASEAAELASRFASAVELLRSGQHERAAIALHGVLVLAPEMPEAHVNMGYALLGMKRHEAARGFFEAASALRPSQANAYYGMAVALEQLHDLPGAVGAMRTYVHLSGQDDVHVRKARAALREWESRLARERSLARLDTRRPPQREAAQ